MTEQIAVRGVMLRASDSGRVIRFRASTPAVDRHGTIIKPEGIRTETFAKNPVFLWAHDGYGGLIKPDPESVIGRVVGWEKSQEAFDVDVEFAPAEANPRAEQAFRLVKSGFLNAVSIGFIPIRWHEEEIMTPNGDREMRTVYDEVELLEVSLVPVPSNPEAVALARDIAQALSRGVVPVDINRSKAPEDEPWKKPTLRDFTDKPWNELTDGQKQRIARHYAWAPMLPPERFTDLKLPHHRPSDGAVVWNGVRSAMAALLGARGGVDIPDEDRRRVYAHLARHYKQFDKEPPKFKAYDEDELRELFPDLVADAESRGEAPPSDEADAGAGIEAIREAMKEVGAPVHVIREVAIEVAADLVRSKLEAELKEVKSGN